MKYLLILLTFTVLMNACSKKNTEQETENYSGSLKVESKAVELLPFYEKLDDGIIRFYVEVRRNWKPTNEYLPNSEHLRVEIFSDSGKLLWSSNHNKNFMQAISDLQPQIPGYMEIYEQLWDGNTNGGTNLNSGKYKVKYTIPAKPEHYSTSITIDWNSEDE